MTSSTLEDTYHDYCRATESGIGYSNCVTSGQGLNLSGPVSFSEMKIRNTLQRSQECLQCHTWLFHTTGSVCALLGLTWDHTISPSFLFRETNLSGFVNIQPKGQQREQVLDKVKANRSRYFKSVSLLGLPCIFTWTNCHKEVVETHILQTPFFLWLWARKFMYTSCVWKFHFSLVFWTQYLPRFLISVQTYCRGKAATVPYLSLPYVWGKHDAGSLVSVLPTFWTPFTLSPPPHPLYPTPCMCVQKMAITHSSRKWAGSSEFLNTRQGNVLISQVLTSMKESLSWPHHCWIQIGISARSSDDSWKHWSLILFEAKSMSDKMVQQAKVLVNQCDNLSLSPKTQNGGRGLNSSKVVLWPTHAHSSPNQWMKRYGIKSQVQAP